MPPQKTGSASIPTGRGATVAARAPITSCMPPDHRASFFRSSPTTSWQKPPTRSWPVKTACPYSRPARCRVSAPRPTRNWSPASARSGAASRIPWSRSSPNKCRTTPRSRNPDGGHPERCVAGPACVSSCRNSKSGKQTATAEKPARRPASRR